ncbi:MULTISPECIES: serine/threonine-protein kinase [unclassified Mycobacterium]|uniref:serine/threonine-protein kinase n=1 Tax=unclassified Mycobacterium TaxID=2642494 RepID=UPI0029C6E697|nr:MULTISPECIES: serine/threonine-protein kinase [unclassified Mycobacterium]
MLKGNLVEGTPFGRYQLIELLGRGGMGEVWRAHDTAIDRVVALKLLLPHYAQDPDFEKRFRREAHAAARLDDPHVVPIYDVGELDGRLYVTMRLIDGVDLQTLLASGPLDAGRAVSVIEQIASALHSAHQAGLVHRDVKPSNILLAHNDFAYLIDFGIARTSGETALTSANTTIGTWAYMAPERFRTGDTEPSSDVYALACVLYECLTGEPPFPGDTLEQVAVGHMVTPPPRPSEEHATVPSAMDRVIATGLAKQPAERYPTTVEMAAAARSAITGPTGPVVGTALDASPDPAQTQHWPAAAPPPVGAPPTTGPGRRTGVLVGAVVAIVLLVAGGVFAVRELSRRHDSTATSAGAAAATALKAGIYRADFGAATNVDGGPIAGAGRETATWGLRSDCNSERCVATASRVSGGGPPVSSLIFDEIDGSWVAVALGSELCDKVPAEVWIVFTLHPDSDGNLSGDYTAVTSGTCSGKGQVAFNRAGDVDVASLPDPASVPPRVSSPAEALHGRYLETTTYANGQPQTQADYAVKTDCLRTGERCMSRFHSPLSGFVPLVFEGGKWTSNLVGNGKCPFGGDLSQVKWTAEYPLPQPPQDPIQSLTGRGHQEQTGSCAVNTDVYIAYKRIGD